MKQLKNIQTRLNLIKEKLDLIDYKNDDYQADSKQTWESGRNKVHGRNDSDGNFNVVSEV